MSKAAKIRPFIEGVFKCLNENDELKALCNGVYDWVPEKTMMPFVTFGKVQAVKSDTKDIDGNKLYIDIIVWDESSGRESSLDIVEQIELSLTSNEAWIKFPSTISLIEWDVETVDNEEQQYGLYCSVVRFYAEVE